MVKFYIITPTIGRPSLAKTVESIKKQDYSHFEHIIVYDGPDTDPRFIELRKKYPKIKATGQRFNDYGHSVRQFAAQFVPMHANNYVGYLDDDDVYINDTFGTVDRTIYNRLLINCEFVFFPCMRLGQLFYHIPAKQGLTTSIQYFHRSIDNQGNRISFTPGDYGHDGEWIEEMASTHRCVYIPQDSPPLAQVDVIGNGV